MKKLFKKPAFWVILTIVIGLIIARIIQVKNNLKKTATNSGAKLGTGAIAKAFFSDPIYTQNEVKKGEPMLLGKPVLVDNNIIMPMGNIPAN